MFASSFTLNPQTTIKLSLRIYLPYHMNKPIPREQNFKKYQNSVFFRPYSLLILS